MENIESNISSSEELVGIDEVQKFLNRSRASVYRYTNTDVRNLNPNFNPRKLNPEYRSDQKDPLMFHPNEIARFAKDILRIKEVTVEVLNSPSSATQNVLLQILQELKLIRDLIEKNNFIDVRFFCFVNKIETHRLCHFFLHKFINLIEMQ